uniref:Metal-nicotianamine transporter YSL3 n=1 Tax=Triticum urartu TaxID=4572 RepID=A0A8R7TKU6_TRIUA
MAPHSRDGRRVRFEEIRELDGHGDEPELGAGHARGRVPPWREQLTARGMVASLAVGAMYSVIVMKLNLTTGLVPTLNVSAALIAFVLLRAWTKALARLGVAARPFTRQENTVVQTCAVACYGIAVGGGFGSYLLALDKNTYEMAGEETEGNVPGSYKEPGIAWMTGFLLAVSFVGIIALVPLRKVSNQYACAPHSLACTITFTSLMIL